MLHCDCAGNQPSCGLRFAEKLVPRALAGGAAFATIRCEGAPAHWAAFLCMI